MGRRAGTHSPGTRCQFKIAIYRQKRVQRASPHAQKWISHAQRVITHAQEPISRAQRPITRMQRAITCVQRASEHVQQAQLDLPPYLLCLRVPLTLHRCGSG